MTRLKPHCDQFACRESNENAAKERSNQTEVAKELQIPLNNPEMALNKSFNSPSFGREN
jgi:hypothetical protein